MGRTKKRGGAKAHRKRVQARNARLKGEMNQMQKLWQDEMMAQLESLRKDYDSSETQDVNTTTLSMGQVETPNAEENTPLDIKL